MNIMPFFDYCNSLLDAPVTLLFFGAAVWMTYVLGFPQFFAFKRFLKGIVHGFEYGDGKIQSMSAFQALCISMASTIGIGTVVGPSLAIVLGGPGALFWLALYVFLGAAIRLVEVTFAVKFRKVDSNQRIIGGPAEYLRLVAPWLGAWYGFVTIFLLASWSGVQAKVFAEILEVQGIATPYLSGIILAVGVFVVLVGGFKRVGALASRVVPVMFILYVSFACWILSTNLSALFAAFGLIGSSIFKACAPMGGFLGATVMAAIKNGTYKGVFITESGMGTASIAQAMSNIKNPVDQGILAMYSVAAELFLCVLSGLLVLATGTWQLGSFSSVLMLKVFQSQAPFFGPLFFTTCIILFIITTAIGNAFNGGQSFAAFFNYRFIDYYYAFVCMVMFISCVNDMSFVWGLADFILPFVAVPHLVGLLILLARYKNLLKIKNIE